MGSFVEPLSLTGPFGSLDLHDSDPFYVTDLHVSLPELKGDWVGALDGDGSVPAEDEVRYQNRTVTVRVRVRRDEPDEVLDAIGELEDAVRQATGLVWTARGEVEGSLRVLRGRVSDREVSVDSGWFAYPEVGVELVCAPFFVSATAETDSGSFDPSGVDQVSGVSPNGQTVLTLDNGSGVDYQRVEIGEDRSSGQLVFDPPVNEGASLTGTVGSDWVNAFEFSVSDLDGRYTVNSRVVLDDGQDVNLDYRWEFTGVGFPQVSRVGVMSGDPVTGSLGSFNVRGGGVLRLQVRSRFGTVDLTGSPDVLAVALRPADALVVGSRTGRVAGSVVGADLLAGGTGVLHGRTAEAGGDWSTSGASGDWLQAVDHVGRGAVTPADSGDPFDLSHGRLALLADPAPVRDSHVAADVFVRSGGSAQLRMVGLVARYSGSTDRVLAGVRVSKSGGVASAWAFISTGSFAERLVQIPDWAATHYASGQWVRMELSVIGSTATLVLDGRLSLSFTHSRLGVSGAVADGVAGFYSFLSAADPYFLVRNWRWSEAAGSVVFPVWPDGESLFVYPDRNPANVQGPVVNVSGSRPRPGSGRLVCLVSESGEPALSGPVDADWSVSAFPRSLSVPR